MCFLLVYSLLSGTGTDRDPVKKSEKLSGRFRDGNSIRDNNTTFTLIKQMDIQYELEQSAGGPVRAHAPRTPPPSPIWMNFLAKLCIIWKLGTTENKKEL